MPPLQHNITIPCNGRVYLGRSFFWKIKIKKRNYQNSVNCANYKSSHSLSKAECPSRECTFRTNLQKPTGHVREAGSR